MDTLFRREAVEYKQRKLHGTILLARAPSASRLIALLTAITALLIIFFFSFGVSRKETVSGFLTPLGGLTRVGSQQTGLILEIKVMEDQLVKAGDVLFVLSSERTSESRGATHTAIARSLRARIAHFRKEQFQLRLQSSAHKVALGERRNALESQIVEIGSEMALQGERINLAETSLRRLTELRETGFVSDAQLQERRAALIDQQGRLRVLERNRSSIAMDLTGTRAELAALPIKERREHSMLERGIAELEEALVELEAQRRFVLRAPHAGRVTLITAEVGQLAIANQSLVSILPTSDELEAELYVPTRAIGFVKLGGRVSLRYQAFPYQKFGQHLGIVREISGVPTTANETRLTRDPVEPHYRVRVKLREQYVQAFGTMEPLRPGMQLEASLLLEERKLYEWVIEPLISIAGRLR